MPRRQPRKALNFIIGEYRKVIKDKDSTIAQRLKAIDRLAVIDGILDIKLGEPDTTTRQPEPGPEVDDAKASRLVKQALVDARKRITEESNELP